MIDLIEQQVQGDEVLGMALSGVWLSERDNLAPKRSSALRLGRSSTGEFWLARTLGPGSIVTCGTADLETRLLVACHQRNRQ